MFNDEAFQSWPTILAGALLFASLFVLLALMIELIFEGAFRVTSTVVGFGIAAFFGYIGTVLIVRQGGPPDGS